MLRLLLIPSSFQTQGPIWWIRYGWSALESRTHFALWIIIKCHLIIGLDGPPSQQLGPHLPLLKNPVSTKGPCAL